MEAVKLFLCSGNRHKVSELSAMLRGKAIVVTPKDLDVDISVDEDATDFEGNALKKARHGHSVSGLVTLADDSGLCVDALGGRPGVRSARLAEDERAGSGDEANNALLLEKLAQVPAEKRGAHYVCAVAVVDTDGRVQTFRGELHGRIGQQGRGSGGFGYDPLFELPDGRTVAMLSAEEKNVISHRGRALAAAQEALEEAITRAATRNP